MKSGDKESILETIKNMLLKGAPGSGASEAEAEACLLRAQRLMAKHNIDRSQVDIGTAVKKEVQNGAVTAKERTVWWKGHLGVIIAENFRCHSYYDRYGKGLNARVQLRFLGLKEDVEIATEVFKTALTMIEYYPKEYLKERKKEAQKKAGVNFKNMTTPELEEFALSVGVYRYELRELDQKYLNNADIHKMRLIMKIKETLGININPTALMNAYILGFLKGLEKKFAEQVKTECLALVLVRDAEVDEACVALELVDAPNTSARALDDYKAQKAGFKRGHAFAGGSKGELSEGKQKLQG